ncbi:MAG: sigma-70 family RNA polymerase sigma factor [bacterium]|nr:sigma-70 family RNA polymerase sigma factor [bacterium]
MNDVGEITQLLEKLDEAKEEGRQAVLEQLMPLVYGELKALARANRYRWNGGQSLGTTSLVHEAFLKLADQSRGDFTNRRQFYAVASKAMRSILIDNARWHGRKKRGGGAAPIALEDSMLVSEQRSEELLALDEALNQLEIEDLRLARIVECRCFGGLTVDETAEALDVSSATVKRGWSLARTWLYRELKTGSV